MKIILASKSPRRQELLRAMGIEKFEIRPSSCETETEKGIPPEEMVSIIACGKAEDVAKTCDDGDIVIAADTLVYLGAEPLGKPQNAEHAAAMLRALSGREHTVYTGVAVFRGEKKFTAAVGTKVFFRALTDAEIDAYVKTGEPMDKAGAYGIQGRGGLFVERIDGDYSNVVGLPVCKLGQMLMEAGYTVLG